MAADLDLVQSVSSEVEAADQPTVVASQDRLRPRGVVQRYVEVALREEVRGSAQRKRRINVLTIKTPVCDHERTPPKDRGAEKREQKREKYPASDRPTAMLVGALRTI
jgi:hypothetical protein